MPNFIDITGEVFSRLTVIERAGNIGPRVAWKCRCTCGSETIVAANHLRNGHTQSCGCLQRDHAADAQRIHGLRFHSLYEAWQGMLQRCENPNHHKYPSYGARGIKVCERWHSFPNFLADMGDKPSPLHSLDRVNNELGYSKDNCRWATAYQQTHNRRRHQPAGPK